MILYEYPFNESIRTMLRLEHLFNRLGDWPFFALVALGLLISGIVARRPRRLE